MTIYEQKELRLTIFVTFQTFLSMIYCLKHLQK